MSRTEREEYDKMRQECKRRFHGAQTGCCTHCGTVIKLDMGRHVVIFQLDDLAKLWWCPVSWCTQWKGTLQITRGTHLCGHTRALGSTMDCYERGVAPGSQAACLRHLYRCATIQCIQIHPGASLPGIWQGASHAALSGPFMAKLRSFASATLRGVRPRDPDDESPLCKFRWATSPVMPEVSSGMHLRVQPSPLV